MEFLIDGPDGARDVFVFAHGAGGGMGTPFMTRVARGLAEEGIRVVRFAFSPRAPKPALFDQWRAIVGDLGTDVVIGGKSMGGRMASMVADELRVRALVCLGYPFHPPGRPDQLRTAHLEKLRTPTLIVQGTRDPFGTREEVAAYGLSKRIRIEWLEDGDHSFKPRKASGRTEGEQIRHSIQIVSHFIHTSGRQS